MRRFSVFFTCCLDEKTINYVLSLINFTMLLSIQVLMSAIQASIEDEIASHLSHGFKVMYTCMPFNNFTNWFWYIYSNSLVLKRIPVVHQKEDLHLVMFYLSMQHTECSKGTLYTRAGVMYVSTLCLKH